jgi:hypothetical protein
MCANQRTRQDVRKVLGFFSYAAVAQIGFERVRPVIRRRSSPSSGRTRGELALFKASNLLGADVFGGRTCTAGVKRGSSPVAPVPKGPANRVFSLDYRLQPCGWFEGVPSCELDVPKR